MHRVSLLFGTTQQFFGEILTRDGGFERALFTTEGEDLFGAHVNDWQLRGIPVVREVMRNEGEHVFYQERIPIRSHKFEAALERWGETHGLISVMLPEDRVMVWEQMLRLPFENAERFSMLITMRAASSADVAVWSKTVSEALRAIETKDPSATKKMLALRKHAAGDLMKTLQKA